MNKKEENIINRLEEIIQKGVSNKFLVQLSELGTGYLNLETIPNYAKLNKLSYNGTKNNREIIVLRSVKFVIDNQ